MCWTRSVAPRGALDDGVVYDTYSSGSTRRVRQALSQVVGVVSATGDWRSHDAWFPSERRLLLARRCSV